MIVHVLKHIFKKKKKKKSTISVSVWTSSPKAPFSFHSDLKWQRMPAGARAELRFDFGSDANRMFTKASG